MSRHSDAMRILLPVLALAGACRAADTAQKPVLPEAAAVAPQAEGEWPQYWPRVAWSAAAKVWLVVWEDGHAASDETARDGRAQDIFAARIDAGGKMLDPKGIPVCTAKDFQGRPVVASDGKDFLVLWQDMRSGKDWDVYAARVGGDGKVLDPDGVLVSGGAHNQCLPAVCASAGGYYAAWLDARHFPEYRVCGGRIGSDAKPLDGEGTELIRPMSDADVERLRTASFAPGKHGKGWHNAVLEPAPPVLASNGKVCTVLSFASGWTGGPGEGGQADKNLLCRVDAATGKPLAPAEDLKLDDAANATKWFYSLKTSVRRPPIVPVGEQGFLMAAYYHCHGFGADGNGVRVAAFLDAEGKPRMDGKLPALKGIVREADQHGIGYRTFGVRTNVLDMAWDGKRALHVSDRYIVEGKESRDFNFDVLGIFLDAEGRRLSDLYTCAAVEPDRYSFDRETKKQDEEPAKVSPFVLAGGAEVQSQPAVAAGDEGSFLVVWQAQPAGAASRVMARLVKVK